MTHIPCYLSQEYFALRAQEHAARKAAQAARDNIDRVAAMAEKLAQAAQAQQLSRQADDLADLLLASMTADAGASELDDARVAQYARTLRAKEARYARLTHLVEDEDARLAFCVRAMRDPAAVEHALCEKLLLLDVDMRRIRDRLRSCCREARGVCA